MLESYSVENFKSFKNHTAVDLKRTNYKVLDEMNVESDILKGALFVGANASGKSNIVLALKLLLDLLFGKNDVNLGLYHSLFPSAGNIMKLEYIFNIQNVRISYSIHYQRKDKLLIEKLYIDEEEILNRLGSTANATITEKTNYDDVPASTLLLRDIWFNTKFRGNVILQQWFEFLSNSIYFDLLSQKGILYKENDISLKKYLDEFGVGEINAFFNEYGFDQTIEYSKESQGDILTLRSDENAVFFKRSGIKTPIPFAMESLGNKILLGILPAFFHAINNGGILILDEFSSGFHNDLEKLLIKYFMKKSRNAQLMLVSHSTNLLSTSLFRPDQLYAVNFNKEGSNIVRFSIEQPRAGQNLEKMYLGGVFSGLPNFKEEFETE